MSKVQKSVKYKRLEELKPSTEFISELGWRGIFIKDIIIECIVIWTDAPEHRLGKDKIAGGTLINEM
jgi:hypothetical protein|tara:strand:- start:426 stop:626 length:201 start_codon:yes stop_codon:yes gene_type:complete